MSTIRRINHIKNLVKQSKIAKAENKKVEEELAKNTFILPIDTVDISDEGRALAELKENETSEDSEEETEESQESPSHQTQLETNKQ